MGRSAKGFTLIEVMIVVAIISILSAVALPAYSKYLVRAKRVAAQSSMLDLANREEQFLLANRGYASLATLEANGFTTPADVAANYSYDVVLGTGPSPSYVITLTATGAQAGDGNLALTSGGVKTPANRW